MGKTTQDRILDAALESFAKDGYKGTNLRDFAAGIGLSKSALYKHYKSKEDIWNAMLDKMENYYAQRFGSPENLSSVPGSCDELLLLTMKMVDFTIHDKKIIMTRKLLLTEQFRDERVRKLSTEHFINGTKDIFKKIFGKMMDAELLIREDSDILALIFTAPITSLIHYCDREPDRETEIMGQIEEFIKFFLKTYARKEGKKHAEN